MFAYRTEIATQFSFKSKYYTRIFVWTCTWYPNSPPYFAFRNANNNRNETKRNEAKGKQHFSTIEFVAQAQKAVGLRLGLGLELGLGHPAATRTCHVS